MYLYCCSRCLQLTDSAWRPSCWIRGYILTCRPYEFLSSIMPAGQVLRNPRRAHFLHLKKSCLTLQVLDAFKDCNLQTLVDGTLGRRRPFSSPSQGTP